MHYLAHFDFKVEGNPLIMNRIGLLHAILSSTKTSDGYSKLVVKADFDKMKGSLNKKVIEVEGLLKTAWSTCCASTSQEHVCVAFGRLNVRLILLLLSKQKYTRDKFEMESFAEIVALFSEELQGNFKVNSPKAAGQRLVGQIEDFVGASAAQVAQFQHHHIKVGAMYLDCITFISFPQPVRFDFRKCFRWHTAMFKDCLLKNFCQVVY